MDSHSPSAADDRDLLIDAVTAAGRVALGHFGADPTVWTKDDGSPVSAADLAADEALAAILRRARPDYDWISEETAEAPGASARAFVVDPIDGTRAFLRRETGWSVVAAVVEAGRPIAAAIVRPAAPVLYAAALGAGATRDGTRLSVSTAAGLDGARVAIPNPVFRERKLGEAGLQRASWISSIALRLARVADGTLDGVVTKAGPHHWDLAAADLIVHEAGGVFSTYAGRAPRYDSAATRHDAAIAAPPRLNAALRAAIARDGEEAA